MTTMTATDVTDTRATKEMKANSCNCRLTVLSYLRKPLPMAQPLSLYCFTCSNSSILSLSVLQQAPCSTDTADACGACMDSETRTNQAAHLQRKHGNGATVDAEHAATDTDHTISDDVQIALDDNDIDDAEHVIHEHGTAWPGSATSDNLILAMPHDIESSEHEELIGNDTASTSTSTSTSTSSRSVPMSASHYELPMHDTSFGVEREAALKLQGDSTTPMPTFESTRRVNSSRTQSTSHSSSQQHSASRSMCCESDIGAHPLLRAHAQVSSVF
jgi:hypothetical protein